MLCAEAPRAYAVRIDNAEPMAAHTAAQREAMRRPTKKSTPVTQLSIRNTWAMHLSHEMTNCPECSTPLVVRSAGSVGVERCRGSKPNIAREANKKSQVLMTKGKVKEFTFHGFITLLRALRTHTVRAEQSASESHIHTVLPRNVGKAQPTNMPLKPHSPCRPSSAGRLRM
jgi:hypothetical protein